VHCIGADWAGIGTGDAFYDKTIRPERANLSGQGTDARLDRGHDLAGTLHASRSDYLITGMVYDNAPTFPLFPLKFAWHMRHFSETTGMPVATRR
jgi:hypothetical protein